jgi:hypothetical protein
MNKVTGFALIAIGLFHSLVALILPGAGVWSKVVGRGSAQPA